MLELRNLCVHHGRAQLLFDLSFGAQAGQVLVLVGRERLVRPWTWFRGGTHGGKS